jgi:hypothetical protein
MARVDAHEYAADLASKVAGRPSKTTSVIARSLLHEFGYHMRNERVVQEIGQCLLEHGLGCELSMLTPAKLDEKVLVWHIPSPPQPVDAPGEAVQAKVGSDSPGAPAVVSRREVHEPAGGTSELHSPAVEPIELAGVAAASSWMLTVW